ncbi:hypothetical protein JCM8097_000908 [Rhodosporidiobolus ruineniae]
MYKRAFSTTCAALKEASTAPVAPLRRTRDPLLSSSTAQHFRLPSGNHFVVRPPPSVVPPSHPLPPQAPAPAALASQAAHSPFAPFFASSSSSSSASSSTSTLLPHLDTAESSLPASRPSPPHPARTLTPTETAELQSLRRSNPARWTRARLATKFGVSQQVVGTLGYGEGADAREAERVRKAQVEKKTREREEGWGWKKSIAREERRRRRTMW